MSGHQKGGTGSIRQDKPSCGFRDCVFSFAINKGLYTNLTGTTREDYE
jgi:hypothetical protein